ncbi:tRNA lysidine(34) synthetase TilS [Phytoactinopolyspora alkaliphila]|uniref:tRNA(Ile)-lysidine synthase n=1 Tax=Phytoactinopolyspora alkaliphila TaxID=1783498 RepID=A0A6N9YM39_9ACTN|nr:tRNA lysidine(34) synthetase TilS [Phytoactinopolyspora alkaliphila]NED95997.1 tRNA lysidine(34) synthetase TilS [Phytoactinopolyspora alkaliphila]
MSVPRLDVRRAVRAHLEDVLAASGEPALVLAACSGGADSWAVAGALAVEGPRAGVRAGAVTVDHGLQAGSAERARSVAAQLGALGLDPVEVVHVHVGRAGGGPEGRARRARYDVLTAAALRHGAAAVLLGHTLDDQAETVLLGLARGSGARSLAGMAARAGLYRRPLLQLSREVVRAAVPGGVRVWEDPHNADPAYARARVRHLVLPVLEKELGPGVAAALARTAELLRADADALDHVAAGALTAVTRHGPAEPAGPAYDTGELAGPVYDTGELAGLPQAVRWRILRGAAIAAGCPPTDLTAAHVQAVDALVVAWRGQKGIDLPGAIRANRRGRALRFGPL